MGERDVAKARSAFYQQQARRYQSREVRAKTYNIGELVLRLPEKKKDKLKPKWEGPFIIDKVLTGGAYRQRDAADNRLEPNPWNAARLRRFYTWRRTLCSSPSLCSFSLTFNLYSLCRCQNRRISGRGSRSVRLRINGNRRQGTRCFTQVRALSMEVKPYVLLD